MTANFTSARRPSEINPDSTLVEQSACAADSTALQQARFIAAQRTYLSAINGKPGSERSET